MYGAKEQRASTDTASLRSMARLSAYAKVADGAERPPSVVAAGVLISDSVSGVERLQPLVEASSQRAFRLQLLLEGPARGAAVGLLLLTFWEIPRWCRADGRCECVWDVDDPSRCPYPTFDIAYVDEYVAVAAQVAGETRSQLRLIFRILPAYLRVGALVSLLLVFFGWFGVVLFPPKSSAQGEAYFANLWQTCWQLFICITTANFPDVMIPAYSHARLPAAVYFGGFLVLGFFFMMNLLLATAASFELGVDALLLLNAVLIAYQTKDELLGTAASDASDVRGVLEALESGFAVLYVAEASLKVAGLGLTQYAANYRNRFDGLVTLASLAAAAYVAYPNSYDNPVLVRYVVMLRLLRLVRLIVALPEFQVLFCVTFFFATVGAALFQGLINADPGAPQLAQLEGTDFYAQGYLPLNFNDYESGFGFVAVSDEWTGRAFFLAFYLVGVLVLLNVVVAFILDAFISELDKTRSLRRAASR
ncbi:hypothetical protein JL722_5844 [Aureococcus anophagefferens]|nr:hypothetical protein JL722_5844 [Aureococcus anophagefferens]